MRFRDAWARQPRETKQWSSLGSETHKGNRHFDDGASEKVDRVPSGKLARVAFHYKNGILLSRIA